MLRELLDKVTGEGLGEGEALASFISGSRAGSGQAPGSTGTCQSSRCRLTHLPAQGVGSLTLPSAKPFQTRSLIGCPPPPSAALLPSLESPSGSHPGGATRLPLLERWCQAGPQSLREMGAGWAGEKGERGARPLGF